MSWTPRKHSISAACTWQNTLSAITQDSRVTTVGEDRNKVRLKNCQLCGIWKLPFCDHRAIELTQVCVCFTNHVSISLFLFTSFVNTTPRYLTSQHAQMHCPLLAAHTGLGYWRDVVLGLFSANFHSRLGSGSSKPIKCMLKIVVRVCKRYWIARKQQTVDPTPFNSNTLVDSGVTVYPIHIEYEEEWW